MEKFSEISSKVVRQMHKSDYTVFQLMHLYDVTMGYYHQIQTYMANASFHDSR